MTKAVVTGLVLFAASCAIEDSQNGDREGLTIVSMAPGEGLDVLYRSGDSVVSYRAGQEGGFHAEIRDGSNRVIASLVADGAGAPTETLGDPAQLARLLQSETGRALAELTELMPWHVDGMHDEFLELHVLYMDLSSAAGMPLEDDGFSVQANQERIARLYQLAAPADDPEPGVGSATAAATMPAPNYPDLFRCPGMPDVCVGMCGSGCNGQMGFHEYTCACVVHDMIVRGDTGAGGNALVVAEASMRDPSKWLGRTGLGDAANCAADPSWSGFSLPSPAFHCSANGASELNSTQNSDGCFQAWPGEQLLSGFPVYMATDYVAHTGVIDGRWRNIGDTDGATAHLDQTGRFKLGISGKASGIGVVLISPGAAICNRLDARLGGNAGCTSSRLMQVNEDDLDYVTNTAPGCRRGASGGSTDDYGHCPDLPIYHKMAAHSYGNYDANNVAPGDYLIFSVSRKAGWGFFEGHATTTVAVYQGNNGNFQPVGTTCGAIRGDGTCQAGEYGWSAPEDCCDVYTPLGQTYLNHTASDGTGQLWCRDPGDGGGLRWLSGLYDDAQWLDQSVPTSMVAGRAYGVSVTMLNNGTTTWSSAPFYLGSQNPQDTHTWDSGRAVIAGSVPPGSAYTFSWNVTAPAGAGNYNFQREMVHELVNWFGDYSGNVVVSVRPSSYLLTASKTGSGSGTVTSSPSGINCGKTCSKSFATDTWVTLTAAPASGSYFAGWSGACSGTGSCSVYMSGSASVAATFSPNTLTVTKTGSGSGTVTSSPNGISCGSTCSKTFTAGASVTLTASPSAGSIFGGWSGACSGTGSCVVSMTGPRSVTATFLPAATCDLHVWLGPFDLGTNPTLSVGQTYTWVITTNPWNTGSDPRIGYWNGTKNGVTDIVDLYAGPVNSPGYSMTYTYLPQDVGNYTRFVRIKNGAGTTVCTTGTITARVQ